MDVKVEIEKYVTKYGESNRQLILYSLTWLESVEPTWGLHIPIDRDDFISSLLNRKANTCANTPTESRSSERRSSERRPSDWYLSVRAAASSGETWAFNELLRSGLSVHHFDEDKKWTQN